MYLIITLTMCSYKDIYSQNRRYMCYKYRLSLKVQWVQFHNEMTIAIQRVK